MMQSADVETARPPTKSSAPEPISGDIYRIVQAFVTTGIFPDGESVDGIKFCGATAEFVRGCSFLTYGGTLAIQMRLIEMLARIITSLKTVDKNDGHEFPMIDVQGMPRTVYADWLLNRGWMFDIT